MCKTEAALIVILISIAAICALYTFKPKPAFTLERYFGPYVSYSLVDWSPLDDPDSALVVTLGE